MIFVTVGTDHHPFDRLIKKVDELFGDRRLAGPVFMQTGAARYRPRFCKNMPFLGFDEMMDYINRASIVITHGGPGSIMPVLYAGKIPVVVPRRKKYQEVVDEHQLYFARRLKRLKNAVVVEDMAYLEEAVSDYDKIIHQMKLEGEKESVCIDYRKDFIKELEKALAEIVKV
ncbi:MAG: hypothetical protein JXB26_18805 [Candidatus Aminicenantes bacterium]|nr:hypothetical protein [Candidatus Aminicenantes bacterium]